MASTRRKSATPSKRTLEFLERRLVLSSVISADPAPASHDAPLDPRITAAFSEEIDPATVTAESFVVHGALSGRLGGAPVADDNTVSQFLLQPLRPGELVEVTATTAIATASGQPMDRPFVWQFRARAVGGTGEFVTTEPVGDAPTFDVALGDLDGDGDLDALFANFFGSEVWLNDGHGHLSDSGQTLSGGFTSSVALGDVDGDGDLDAAFGRLFAPSELWLNDGAGLFSDSGQRLGGSFEGDTYGVALGDVDGDGDLDLVTAMSDFYGDQFDGNNVWINDGSGGFTDSGQRIGDADSFGVALGDVDGDGHLDAVFANSEVDSPYFGPQDNGVWLNDGTGHFQDPRPMLDLASSHDVALGDLDGDGDLDAYVGNTDQPDHVFLGDGQGNFHHSGGYLGTAPTYSVALGDLDGDGDLDVFVTNGAKFSPLFPPNEVFLNDGSGNMIDTGQQLDPTISTGVALGDVDGDGDLDAVVGNVGYNEGAPNDILVNDNGGHPADFDSDGDVDGDDFLRWQAGFGIDDRGDADGDGDTDGDDFLIWQSNLGSGNSAGRGAVAQAGQSDRRPAGQAIAHRVAASSLQGLDRALSERAELRPRHHTSVVLPEGIRNDERSALDRAVERRIQPNVHEPAGDPEKPDSRISGRASLAARDAALSRFGDMLGDLDVHVKCTDGLTIYVLTSE